MNTMASRKTQRRAKPKERGSPKYPTILSNILKDLQEGVYSPGTRLPTDSEFAQRLRVGRLTVGRALRELARDGHLVRRRGSGTYAAEVGAQPLPGRNIRVGVLCPGKVLPAEVETTFWGRLLRGLLKHWKLDCAATQFELGAESAATRAVWGAPNLGIGLVALGPAPNSLERHPPLELLERERLDCLIVLSPLEDSWLEGLLSAATPAVLVDYPGRKFAGHSDSVYLDPISSYAEAVDWLVGQGCRRLHFLGALIGDKPPADLRTLDERAAYQRSHKITEPDSRLREHAFRMAMDACGSGVSAGQVHAVSFNARTIQEWGRQMAGREACDKPEAIVCAVQRHAEVLCALFKELKQDIRVVGTGYDGVKSEAHIQVDCEAVADAAAALVVARLQKPRRVSLRVGVNMMFKSSQNL